MISDPSRYLLVSLSSLAFLSRASPCQSVVRRQHWTGLISPSYVRLGPRVLVEVMMGKRDQASKISLRSSLFPNVPPYLHFTSVVLKDVLPTVRSPEPNNRNNISSADSGRDSSGGSGPVLFRQRMFDLGWS